MQECWRRRYASFLHLKLNEVSEIHPLYIEHELVARRDLAVRSILCGTDLASCPRSSATLLHHCPNMVETLPILPYPTVSAFTHGCYSWSTRDLLTHGLEGLIFSSALLATKSHRISVHASIVPNIVLLFLGNGLTCGEVIELIRVGKV